MRLHFNTYADEGSASRAAVELRSTVCKAEMHAAYSLGSGMDRVRLKRRHNEGRRHLEKRLQDAHGKE
jgi:hypothetical protein